MANATQSRSSDASRAEEMRLAIPRLEDTRIISSDVSALCGDEDEPLDQALAILNLLSAAFTTAEIYRGREELTIGEDTFSNLFIGKIGPIYAEALNGVTTLIAVSRHLGDVKRVERANALRHKEGQ